MRQLGFVIAALSIAFVPLAAHAAPSTSSAQAACSRTPLTCAAGQQQWAVPASTDCPTGGFVCKTTATPASPKHATTPAKSSTIIASTPKTSPLSYGMRGQEVLLLQQKLASLGYLTADLQTGFFGKMTLSAVQRFQRDRGLEPVGYVGPKTKALIAKVSLSGTTPGTTPPTTATPNTTTAPKTTPAPSVSPTGGGGSGGGGGGTNHPATTSQPPTTSCVLPTPSTETRTSTQCPTGQTGVITETRAATCASGATNPTWGGWGTTSNTCSTPIQTHVPITNYTNFINTCHAIVTGNQSTPPPAIAYPLWEHFSVQCTGTNRDHPILFSVTHEKNASHAGAVNNIPNAAAYMGDYNYPQDFGRWLNYGFTNDPARDFLMGMSFDTLNYKATNVTGWSIQEGNIFFGFNDMTIRPTTLDREIVVEFDMRMRGDNVGTAYDYAGYSGHNIGISTIVKWKESGGRANTTHYFGVILDQTPNYAASWNFRDLPLCHDTEYVGCWYDPEGTYNEGRNVDYKQRISPSFKLNNLEGLNPGIGDGWQHVRIPMSSLIKQLGWTSPPSSWSDATFEATTFGLESTGATRYWIELKNYQVYYISQ